MDSLTFSRTDDETPVYDSTDRAHALVALGGDPLPKLTPKARTAIRLAAGCSKTDRCPVKVVRGTWPPTQRGQGFYHATKGGTVIDHPNAYAKKGWSNVVYHASTLRVVVGRDWLLGLDTVSP